MRTKPTTRLAVAIALVVGCLGFMAAPASANPHTGTIVPPSEIVLHPNIGGSQTFPLGVPPDPDEDPPPPGCNVADPDDWEPSTIDFDVDETPPPPHAVTTNFAFQPGAAQVGANWYRVTISGSGSGTITPDTPDPGVGWANLTVSAQVVFQSCSGSNPTVCTVNTTINLTGTVTPYPIQTGVSVADVSGSSTLSTSGCSDFALAIGLSGASADTRFVIQF